MIRVRDFRFGSEDSIMLNPCFTDFYFWLFAGLPNPNYDYSGDDYQYNDDNELVNEEEEMEMQYDINFLNIGNSQIVDKGTTIKLPCNVDMYPGRLQITTLYRRSGTRVCQQKYHNIRNKREKVYF